MNMASAYPFEAPPENCMICELEPGFLTGVEGKVVYPVAFGGEG